MKERPILFAGDMVRAILDGRKTQTRRAVKSKRGCPIDFIGGVGMENDPTCWGFEDGDGEWWALQGNEQCRQIPCPYGQPGDRLWVRETWTPGYFHNADADDGPQVSIIYRADSADMTLAAPSYELAEEWERSYAEDGPDDPRWRPSIHMPRWASRILLEIVSVRVERLQGISESDAWNEGVQEWMGKSTPWKGELAPVSVHGFASLWEHISGSGSWAANPWVWVVEFKRVGGDA